MARPFPSPHRLLPLLLFLFLLPFSPRGDEGEVVSVEAPLVAVEIGDTATIACTTTEDKPPRWFRGENASGQSPIPEDSSLRVFSDARQGALTVTEARLNDSGTYLCQAFSAQHSATMELRVYEMPSYSTEGGAIIGISVVLLVLFIGGIVFQHVRRRRQARKGEAKLRVRMQSEA